MKIQGIIFDMDGLLIDSERVYRRVSYELAGELGVQLTDDILSMQMARSPVESMKIFIRECGLTGHSAEELAERRDRMMLKAFDHDLTLLPGAGEIIREFHGRVPMAIATGSPRMLMDKVLDQLSLRHYFTFLQPSDGIRYGKPNPEIYLLAAAGIRVEPESCVVLEDASNGALAAKRAGCHVIAVPNIQTEHQDFLFVDAVLGDLFQAADLIRSMVEV